MLTKRRVNNAVSILLLTPTVLMIWCLIAITFDLPNPFQRLVLYCLVYSNGDGMFAISAAIISAGVSLMVSFGIAYVSVIIWEDK